MKKGLGQQEIIENTFDIDTKQLITSLEVYIRALNLIDNPSELYVYIAKNRHIFFDIFSRFAATFAAVHNTSTLRTGDNQLSLHLKQTAAQLEIAMKISATFAAINYDDFYITQLGTKSLQSHIAYMTDVLVGLQNSNSAGIKQTS